MVSQKGADNLMTVSPEVADIQKHQSIDVLLKFNPLLEFQFMGSTLECFLQYREMRNANIIEVPTLPFVIAPFCDGHTLDDVHLAFDNHIRGRHRGRRELPDVLRAEPR
jgi:hypothetical protein